MKRSLDDLVRGEFDLLIIGGGITGAGVALDASLRGLRVALIDKGDFASGTSGVSSKLVHGGLRYLEHAQFSLVHEALHERQRLLQNAPHLVWPLPFLLPFFSGARVPAWQWRVALTLYDVLAGSGNIQRSRPLPVERIRREWPQLTTTGLEGGALYFDAQMEDARLCLAVLRSANQQGACVANYVEARTYEASSMAFSSVRAADVLTGQEFSLRARVILNAAGPWVDEVLPSEGPAPGRMLETTKGVHLIVEDQRFPTALLLLHPRDGRVFFVLPWLGKTLIGTTDTFHADSPDRLVVTPEDIHYLLEGYNHFSQTPLTHAAVLHAFAGLRPLLKSNQQKESSRSREFAIFTSPNGIISVAGGKYTTYRSMAEKVTDQVTLRLGIKTRCRTKQYRLDGTPSEPWASFLAAEPRRLMARFGIAESAATHLVRRYGSKAADVAEYIQGEKDKQPIVPTELDMPFEFRYQREKEMAIREEDFLTRRSRLAWLAPTERNRMRDVLRRLSLI